MHWMTSVGDTLDERSVTQQNVARKHSKTCPLSWLKALEKSRDSTAKVREITRQCNIALPWQARNLITRPTMFSLLLFFFLLFSTREAWLSYHNNIVTWPEGADLKHHGDRWTVASRILQGTFAVLSWYTRHPPQITRNHQFKEAARNSIENSNLLSCTYRGM